MSHREEPVSTRDLASTPPEDTARTSDQHDEVGTGSREGAVATADDRGATAERDDVAADAPVEHGRPESTEKRDEVDDTALLPDDQGAEFHERWESIQTTFVDDPRNALENADALVAELMQRLADGVRRRARAPRRAAEPRRRRVH